MPTVETINVEIGANLPRLEQNMRQAEQRVDRAAVRMASATRKVGGAGSALGFGVGGLMGGRSLAGMFARLGPAALGFGAGALGAGGIQGMSQGATALIGGLSRTFRQLDSSVLFSSRGLEEFGKLMMKNTRGLPAVLDKLGNVADEAYARFKNIPGPAENQSLIARARFLSASEEDVGFDLRAAKAVTEEQKKQIEYERKLAEIMREQNNMLAAADNTGDKLRIIDIANKQREIAAIERDRKSGKAPPAFSQIGTVFGAFKIPNGRPQQEQKIEKNTKDTAKNTENTAKAVRDLFRAISQAMFA